MITTYRTCLKKVRISLKYLNISTNSPLIVLRLYPSVPINSRVVIVDIVLPVGGGLDYRSLVLVPKDTVLIYSAYYIYIGRKRPTSYKIFLYIYFENRLVVRVSYITQKSILSEHVQKQKNSKGG